MKLSLLLLVLAEGARGLNYGQCFWYSLVDSEEGVTADDDEDNLGVVKEENADGADVGSIRCWWVMLDKG